MQNTQRRCLDLLLLLGLHKKHDNHFFSLYIDIFIYRYIYIISYIYIYIYVYYIIQNFTKTLIFFIVFFLFPYEQFYHQINYRNGHVLKDTQYISLVILEVLSNAPLKNKSY